MEIIEENLPKTTRDRVKFVANLVVGTSVSQVIKAIVRQNFTPANNLQVVELYVAAYTLGSLVAKRAEAHTDERIDKAADFLMKLKRDAETIDQIKHERDEQK